MIPCPRPGCGGQLIKDPAEKGIYVCMWCSRRFSKLFGKLVEQGPRPGGRGEPVGRQGGLASRREARQMSQVYRAIGRAWLWWALDRRRR